MLHSTVPLFNRIHTGGKSDSGTVRSPSRPSVDTPAMERSPGHGTVTSNQRPTSSSFAILEEMTQSILLTVSEYFGLDSGITAQEIEATIREAITVTDENYGIEAAIEWGAGYCFPAEMINRDVASFHDAGLDFEEMIRHRLRLLRDGRLNRDRVLALSPDNPERLMMLELAEGMHVSIPTGFTPNGRAPHAALRSSYLRVHSAVDKMLADLILQRLAFVIPKAMAMAYINKLHLGAAHWTLKKNKASGRPICDLTHVEGTSLNGEETSAAAEAHYGKIILPTIEDVAKMILEFWATTKAKNPTARWEDLRIWKMDLRGAYQLLSFRPEDVGLFGMEVAGDLVYLQVAGIFGWNATPAAFHVVTKALLFEMRKKLASSVLMYVDDIVGVCLEADLAGVLRDATTICISLLGPSSVADEKTEHGTRLDIIGYVVDLMRHRISISRKNMLNTLYGFYHTDTDKRITLHAAQRLASWASRYSKICRAMRPSCGALHRLTSGRTNRHASFDISPEAKIAIRMWRAMLCLVRFDETRFSRSIESFSDTPPVYVIEFDASLTGAGILWIKRHAGAEVVLGGSAVDLRFLGFNEDSSFQNLCEYLAALLGLIGMVVLGIRGVEVEARGDNVSALSWIQKERARGDNVTNAWSVFTMLCLGNDLSVKVGTHIAGVNNIRCDALSRLSESKRSIEETLGDVGLGGTKVVDLQGRRSVMQLLRCCDPTVQFNDEDSFLDFWNNIKGALGDLNRGE